MAYKISELDRQPTLKTLLEKRDKYSVKDLANFVPNPTTRDAIANRNENSIKMALKALLRTRNGERVGRPEIGTTIDDALFEFINNISADSLKTTIKNAIDNQASDFIEILDITVEPKEEQNGYSIYMIIQFKKNPSETITVTDFLERI